MKKFNSWEEVFESFTNEEKAEIRSQVADVCGQESVSDEKIWTDVENYFNEYVDGTTNCYGNEVPDTVDGQLAYTKENFLWALS